MNQFMYAANEKKKTFYNRKSFFFLIFNHLIPRGPVSINYLEFVIAFGIEIQ